MFHFSNYSAKSKYSADWNKFVADQTKDERGGVIIKTIVGLKPKMYSFWVDNNSEHRKVKGVNKNVVEAISYNEYIDVLLNKKHCWHAINWIQDKYHRLGTSKINNISLSWLDDKIHILNNGYNGLAFGC